jgi:Flp pilus assembly protein TadG
LSKNIITGQMNRADMACGSRRTLFNRSKGQSMVEFALILPLFVLFIIGIFDLGRAFFAYIAITNAAREGTRVATFWPGKTTIDNVKNAVDNELASSPTVNPSNPHSVLIECSSAALPNPVYQVVTNDGDLETCPSMNPIRVTVTYQFDFILKFFIPSLDIKRSAEMLMP